MAEERTLNHYRIIANVVVGAPDTAVDAPSHTPGIVEGNSPKRRRARQGLIPDGAGSARATAERSTGINARNRNPIDPRMPNLPPP